MPGGLFHVPYAEVTTGIANTDSKYCAIAA
jgi:hypothetical protein